MLLILEALNQDRPGDFGQILERLYKKHIGCDDRSHNASLPHQQCTESPTCPDSLLGQPTSVMTGIRRPTCLTTNSGNPWVWIPTVRNLREHYCRDIGFLACLSMLVGVIIFWIPGLTSLPPIYSALDTEAELYAAYWVPLLLGGICFVLSGILFTIETQARWWCPAPSALGWHVSVWTLIGAIGFLLYPVFGMAHNIYQASCSSLWGKASIASTM